jgi:hypothetical protein
MFEFMDQLFAVQGCPLDFPEARVESHDTDARSLVTSSPPPTFDAGSVAGYRAQGTSVAAVRGHTNLSISSIFN